MKRIITLVCCITYLHTFSQPLDTGLLTLYVEKPAFPGVINNYNGKVYNTTENYVNGGLIITYPTDFWTFFGFPSTPQIVLSIKLNGPASPTDTYSAVVSTSTPDSATIIVYRISNGGTVVEANTNEVSVVFLAIQDLSEII
jgi:hypothetical protein